LVSIKELYHDARPTKSQDVSFYLAQQPPVGQGLIPKVSR